MTKNCVIAKNYGTNNKSVVVAAFVGWAAFAGAVRADYASEVLADNPVAYYRLEDAAASGTAADSSANATGGTVDGMITQGVPGKVGNAVDFGGTGYFDAPKTYINFDVGDPFTLEGWVNTTNMAAGTTGIIAHWNVAPIHGYYLGMETGRASGQINRIESEPGSPVEYSYHVGSKVIADGQWHHLVMTHSPGGTPASLALYVDGALATYADPFPQGATVTSLTEDSDLGLGRRGPRHDNNTNAWLGLLDELAIYASVLSPARIQAHFNAAGLPGDFNSNGKVDGADFLLWQRQLGSGTALPNDNGLGTPIGSGHLALWKSNFGSGAATPIASAVPEPVSLQLLLLSLVSCAASAARRRGKRTHSEFPGTLI